LRSFYKKGAPPERELVDVNELVREMLVLLRSEANRYSIGMRTDLATERPKVTVDRVQLQQVLMNLMLNGIEAMRDTAGELTIRSELGEDRQVLISVSDTGMGLPAEGGSDLRCILSYQNAGLRHGAGDQPFHRRVARWPFVGNGERRTGRNILFHSAGPSRLGESAPCTDVIQCLSGALVQIKARLASRAQKASWTRSGGQPFMR
jgi:hypothetical protein